MITFIKKVIKFTSIFYKIRDKLSTEVKKLIYFAFVHSLLNYGIEIYGNTYSSHLNKLFVLNNKILRILQHSSYDSPIIYLYSNYNTLSLPNLHKFNILLFVHKCLYHPHQLPHVFSSYYLKNSDLHSYNTRSKNDPYLEQFTTSLGQRCIIYKGSYLWCSLPDELKDISSTSLFKSRLKKYLQSQ